MQRFELEFDACVMEVRICAAGMFGPRWPGFVTLMFSDNAGRVLAVTKRLFSKATLRASVADVVQKKFLPIKARQSVIALVLEHCPMPTRRTQMDRIEMALVPAFATYFLHHLFGSLPPEAGSSQARWRECRPELDNLRPSVEFLFPGIAKPLGWRSFSIAQADIALIQLVRDGLFSAEERKACLAALQAAGLPQEVTQEDLLCQSPVWGILAFHVLGLIPPEAGSGETRFERAEKHVHLFVRGVARAVAHVGCLCDVRACLEHCVLNGYVTLTEAPSLFLQAQALELVDHEVHHQTSGGFSGLNVMMQPNPSTHGRN